MGSEHRALTASARPTTARQIGAWLALGLVALLLWHLHHVLQRDRMVIFGDEACYMGHARYLAGGLPYNMDGSASCHPGYGLLVSPAYWLFKDPTQVFTGVVVINSLLLTALFPALYAWLRTLHGTRRPEALTVALAVSLYPAFSLQSSFTHSETAFILVFVGMLLAAGQWLQRPTVPWGLAFAALAALLYTIHPRGLGVVAVAGAWVLFVTARGLVPRAVGGGVLVSLGALFAGGRWWVEALAQLSRGGQGSSVESLGAKLVGGDAAVEVGLAAVGQLWYLGVATVGLAVYGAVHLLHTAWAPGDDSPAGLTPASRRALAGLAIGAAGAVLVASIAFLSFGSRGDHLIYGRYNEGFVAILIASGLVRLLSCADDPARRWSDYAVWIGLLGVAAFVLLGGRGARLATKVNHANIMGILHIVRSGTGMNVGAISIYVATLTLGLTVMAQRARWAVPGLLGGYFALGALFVHDDYVMRIQGYTPLPRTLATAIRVQAGTPTVSYDRAEYHAPTFFLLQHLLPRHEVLTFDSRSSPTPPTDLIVVPAAWRPPEGIRAVRLASDPDSAHDLWTLAESAGRYRFPYVIGVPFGAVPVDGVEESGFLEQEWVNGLPARWTDGVAALSIPLPAARRPAAVAFELSIGAPGGTPVTLILDRHTVLESTLPQGSWTGAFSLPASGPSDTLAVEIWSEVFVPAETAPGSSDTRRLGVSVRGITLLQSFDQVPVQPDPLVAYASVVTVGGAAPPFEVARGTDLSLPLVLHNPSTATWPSFKTLGQADGSVRVGIRWTNEEGASVAVSPHRIELPSPVPSGATIEMPVTLTTTDARDGQPLPAGRYRVNLGLVQDGVAWFDQRGDDDLIIEVVLTD